MGRKTAIKIEEKKRRREIRKKRDSHPLYSALIETGLFEDLHGDEINKCSLIFAKLRLIGTNYVFTICFRNVYKPEWFEYPPKRLPHPVSFEVVFDNLQNDIREKLIWILDLIS